MNDPLPSIHGYLVRNWFFSIVSASTMGMVTPINCHNTSTWYSYTDSWHFRHWSRNEQQKHLRKKFCSYYECDMATTSALWLLRVQYCLSVNLLDHPEGPLDYFKGPRGVFSSFRAQFLSRRLILLLRVRYGYYECDMATTSAILPFCEPSGPPRGSPGLPRGSPGLPRGPPGRF